MFKLTHPFYQACDSLPLISSKAKSVFLSDNNYYIVGLLPDIHSVV